MRTLAEDVARFADLDLLDGTGAEAVVIAAADVGRPLRQVPPEALKLRQLSPLPPHNNLNVSTAANRLRVEISTGNIGWFCALACAIVGILSWITVSGLRAESLRQWLIAPIFGGAAMLLLLVFGSTSLPRRSVLEADVNGLRLSRYRLLGKKSLLLRPEALRGLKPGPLVLTVRYESGQWHVHGITSAEMEWLVEALSDALAGHVVLHNPATV